MGCVRIACIVSRLTGPLERRAAGQHLVEHDAEREDVAAVIDPDPARLFGRHVRGGAQNDAGIRAGAMNGGRRRLAADRLDQLCEAEVDDLGVALLGHHDVGRLQVAVDDALLVRARETLGTRSQVKSARV